MQRKLSGSPPKLFSIKAKCDTHIHFYDDKYRTLPGTPSPAAASVTDYRRVMQWLGIERVVVVQPNAYGDDNRCTMDAVRELGANARAVVVVKPCAPDDELARPTQG